jgi:ribonuclease E
MNSFTPETIAQVSEASRADAAPLRTIEHATALTAGSSAAVAPAPMMMDELQGMLASAGLQLVQTATAKHAEAQARMAAEPAPVRVRRDRPRLPPLDDGPLIQVETSRGNGPRVGV